MMQHLPPQWPEPQLCIAASPSGQPSMPEIRWYFPMQPVGAQKPVSSMPLAYIAARMPGYLGLKNIQTHEEQQLVRE